MRWHWLTALLVANCANGPTVSPASPASSPDPSSSGSGPGTAQLLDGRTLTADDGDIVPCGTGVIAVTVHSAAQLARHRAVSTTANFVSEQVVVVYPTEDAPRKATGKEGVVVRDAVRDGRHKVSLSVTYDGGTANTAAAIVLPREDEIACSLDR